tara:strand:- start:54 stop:491 length:438 start_codon:yes stop_codon:yes gene_type:complete
MSWRFNGHEFTQRDVGSSFGFVYCIHNLVDKKRYIGKKFFTVAGRKQVKGKKKKIRKPSDWETYWGSNNTLINDVKKHGEDKFIREILYICSNRSDCAYLELKEQIDRRVLERDDYYNDWIMVKVTGKNLRFLSEQQQSYISPKN